jgi:hypothetical protein
MPDVSSTALLAIAAGAAIIAIFFMKEPPQTDLTVPNNINKGPQLSDLAPVGLPQGTSSQTPDKCAGAESHFNAAINLRDIDLKRQRLREFVARFLKCDFYDDAVVALADTKSTPPAQTAPTQVAPAPDQLTTTAKVLPPITVTASRHTYVSMDLGEQAILEPRTTYRLRLHPFFTTTIGVLEGTIILKIDGVAKFERVAGEEFRVFTRGWSTFEVQTRQYQAHILATRTQNGDYIGSN